MVFNKIAQGINAYILYLRDVSRKPPDTVPRVKITENFFFFIRFVKPVFKLYLLCIVLTIVLSLLRSILPLSGKLFIDFVVTKEGYRNAEQLLGPLYPGIVTPELLSLIGSLYFIVAAMFVLGVAVSLLGILLQYTMQRAGQELTLGIQTALFNRVLRFPMSYLKTRQTGYLMSRVSGDVSAIQNLMNLFVNLAFSSIFSALFCMFFIFSLNAKLSLILSLIIPANVLINSFFSKRLRSVSRNDRENTAQISRDLQEILSGVELVKTSATEEKETKKVTDKIRTSNAIKLNSMLLSAFSSFFIGGTQSMLTMLIMLIGAAEISSGTMTIGDYFAFTAYALIITGSLNSLLNLQLSLQPTLVSLERLQEMFGIQLETECINGDKPPAVSGRVEGHIQFEDVTFSYTRDKQTLDHISFDVSRGEIVALVGRSGSGKTTLANLLLKLYTPDSGAIYLDGQDIGDLDTTLWRNMVSVVSQDIFLFNDTIENNIKYGNLQASHEQVVEAARNAHIHEHIMSLPDQYDTVIGEKGSMLSVGQRQRISIARAFLKDVPILVLDEPTSSLDTVTEAMLRDSLKTLAENRTVIIISHRMFVCDMATRILVLSNGTIAEAGTHEELLRTGRLYPEIYTGTKRKTVVAEAVLPRY